MIPAILSCVFVIYLYRTLKVDPSADSENRAAGAGGGGGANGSSNAGMAVGGGETADSLQQRLAELETRLEQLAASRPGGGN